MPRVNTAIARNALPPDFHSPATSGAINAADDAELVPPLPNIAVPLTPFETVAVVTLLDAAVDPPCSSSH